MVDVIVDRRALKARVAAYVRHMLGLPAAEAATSA
jgi:hypothetical protein